MNLCLCNIAPGEKSVACPVRNQEMTPHLVRCCRQGRLPAPKMPDNECQHRGGLKRMEECKSCTGFVELKVFDCAVFGECSLGKSPPGVQSCRGCDRREQASPCYPNWTTEVTGLSPDPIQINCSIFDWKGRRILAWRKKWARSQVWISELDGNNATSNKMIEIPPSVENLKGCEDPRLFEHDGRLHLEYIGWNEKYASVCVAELDDDFNVVANWTPQYDKRAKWEKNWGFFSHDDRLFSVYSIQPHKVLEFRDGRTIGEHTAPKRMTWSHGSLRGGASPVLHDGVWWSFFHGTTDAAHGRVYSVGCYTFENKPPFKPLSITPRPILVPDPIDRPGASTPYVVFPCGAVRDGGKWLVSYGYYDRTCRLAEFDAEQLKRAMVSV